MSAVPAAPVTSDAAGGLPGDHPAQRRAGVPLPAPERGAPLGVIRCHPQDASEQAGAVYSSVHCEAWS
jgi:hypothetical protein